MMDPVGAKTGDELAEVKMSVLRQRIERLASGYPAFFLEPHIVAAVAVLSDYSNSPARFAVQSKNITQLAEADEATRLEISWQDETEDKAGRLRATMQRRPLIELAATTVALVITRRVLNLGRLDVTAIGDRADYRSVRRGCVVEISGTELLQEFDRRHRQKIAQALANPFGWDAYVVVCLFSAEGHRIRLSRHEYQEQFNA